MLDVEEEERGGKAPDHFLGREVEADRRTRWPACCWPTTLSWEK